MPMPGKCGSGAQPLMTDLFLFPSAMRRDPAVDAWLASQRGELGDMARRWFDQLRRCGDDVRELVHDGCPVTCAGDVAFGYVNVFTSHVNVGFFRGALLDDPDDLLRGAGKRMRHVKLQPGRPSNDRALPHLIEEAYAEARRAPR